MSEGEFKPPTNLPTVFDPTFTGVGKQAGLTIWRVEKLKVSKKPSGEKCYKGHFYDGDSYIILYVKATGAALEKHIYFWLGKETSQDEQGVAAYKTVELDESMGGEAVQHREVMGSESAGFRRVFPKLYYEKGGIATGFKHVDPDAFEPRLLHVKGRRKVVIQEVDVSNKSMNTGDVFIADCGRDIIQWNGALASHVEKMAGIDFCNKLRDDDKAGDAVITIIDREGDDDAIFWEKLGIAKGFVETAKPGKAEDDEFARKALSGISLHKISDASGSTNITKCDSVKQENLKTEDVFLLDIVSEVFVWVGKKASKNERLHSMRLAVDYLKSKSYPNSTPVTRCVEEAEPTIFKSYFPIWKEEEDAVKIKRKQKSKSFVKRMFKTGSMHHTATREERACVDDGSGEKKVWRIEDFKRAPVTSDENIFHSGDSYVVHYQYDDSNSGKKGHIVYFWQGTHTTQDEAGAAALIAVEIDDELGGEATQIRVTQNHEPRHFLQMFQGKFVVKAGGVGSGFKNRDDKDAFDKDGTYLYRIQSGANEANEWAVRTVQVAEKAASLNSLDCYLLEHNKKFYLWAGKGSTGDEQKYAKAVIQVLSDGKDFQNVTEGKEPAAFWEAVGGKGDYAKSTERKQSQYREPRLFQASNSRGYFYVEEILHFDQTDLIEDDVMILDTYHEVFVWVGKGAQTEEKKRALQTAIEYVKTDPTGRSEKDTIILQIKQGYEPPSFTGQFVGWDPKRFTSGANYDELKSAVSGADPVSASAALQSLNVSIVPYKDLVKNCPEGVDKTKKEQYLSDEEFKKYFKMTKADFAKLPAWKEKKLKQKVGLY